MTVKRVVVTTGEPAGIGPDISLAIAAEDQPFELVLAGHPAVLAARAAALGLKCQFDAHDPGTAPRPHAAGRPRLLAIDTAAPVVPGRLDRANAHYVLALLDRAADGCLSGEFTAMTTAPVHKGVINEAGIAFTGHTEYLAARLDSRRPVMLLVAGTLRVAVATTHLPLRAVPEALSTELLIETLTVLDAGLRARFALESPRILVCGLNPHAGEGGHLGTEEIEVIRPAIEAARQRGIDARGPLPADTAFTPASLADGDAVLAMFHDQGLPVLKHAGFGLGVNVTLGLPVVRTSVDHGTALELAATGRADPGSLRAAVALAAGMKCSSTVPGKRFGQHFLHDRGVVGRIVNAIDPQPGDRLVEIGPGLGALTLPLLERAGRLEVIEIDRDVIPRLEALCHGHGDLIVRNEDVLETDFMSLAAGGPPLRVCGNLPYNISTPLLFRLLDAAGAIRDMHFMLQKEVVDRMVAPPGGKEYGRLTVMLAAVCRCERLFRVGAGAFSPPPKVESAVVRITPLGAAPFPLPDRERFASIVAAAFSMRRKTLRNSLRGLVDDEAFASSGIDPGRRAETLRPGEFGALAATPPLRAV